MSHIFHRYNDGSNDLCLCNLRKNQLFFCIANLSFFLIFAIEPLKYKVSVKYNNTESWSGNAFVYKMYRPYKISYPLLYTHCHRGKFRIDFHYLFS